VIRPPHAGVANAVGAAIAQIGAQVEQLVSYDKVPRASVIAQLSDEARARVAAAGGDIEKVQIVDVDEVFLSYMPGRAAQVRVRAVSDLVERRTTGADREASLAAHAH
jgi:hypothetical protein